METEKNEDLWRIAKKRVAFKRQLATYIVINSFFWIIWFLTDSRTKGYGVPWPIFPMVGWGIGLMFAYLNAFVFVKHDAIAKEYEKLKGK